MTSTRWPRGCARWSGEVDLVLDPLCGVPASAALLYLADDGRLVNLGSSAGAAATFSSALSAHLLRLSVAESAHLRTRPGGTYLASGSAWWMPKVLPSVSR